jgi:DNA polymerase-3 subunit gamma/tau
MTAVLQAMAVLQAVPSRAESADSATDPDAADTARLAALMPADETQLLYSLCLHGRGELGLAPDEYAALTMVLLRLLAFKPGSAVRSGDQQEKKTLIEARAPERAPPAAPQAASPVPPQVAPLQAPAPARTAVPAVGAPPGRVLPVVEPAPARPAQRPPVPSNGRPGSEVVGVPVRQQAESFRENPASALTLVPTEEGDFWHATVSDLVAREAITALVRELGLQSQLVGRDEGHWMLRVERESLNQPASRERLQNALLAAGHAVKLSVEVGTVTDSPARRNAAAAAEKQRAAEEVILADPFVQDMMRDFGAKIVPGSIKPIPHK